MEYEDATDTSGALPVLTEADIEMEKCISDSEDELDGGISDSDGNNEMDNRKGKNKGKV